MTQTVKYFHSAMQGAPQLSNAWGCITGLLDACLVTGFNVKAISGITSAAGVATAVIDAGHAFEVGQVVSISGTDQAAYNGEVRVSSTTTNNFTYAVAGSPASPATGASMSVKAAPLGWEIVYTGTNKRAYRSLSVLSNKPVLRVDDSLADGYDTTWAKYAKVTLAQGMSDIDTFVGARAPFDPANPTRNEVPEGAGASMINGWYRWYYAAYDPNGYTDSNAPTAGTREWTLVGDDRGFYFIPQIAPPGGGNLGGRTVYAFLDFPSYRPSDGFNTLLLASDGNQAPVNGCGVNASNALGVTLNFSGKILMRDHTQVGGNVRVGAISLNTRNTATQVSGAEVGIPWPNGPDFSLLLHPIFLRQENYHLRGRLPGLLWVLNDAPPHMQGEVLPTVVGYAGKTFRALRFQTATPSAAKDGGMFAIDTTGPWWE